jgi:DNA-directed RNA polymerase specialized sigma24 family protein
MFGYAAFAQLPFATIGAAVIPPPPPSEVFLGGHFGFDERDKGWEEEKQQETKRRERIKTALFGLPPDQREKITSAPTETINIAAQTVITYDAVMVQIETLRQRIEYEQDEEDFETLLELL